MKLRDGLGQVIVGGLTRGISVKSQGIGTILGIARDLAPRTGTVPEIAGDPGTVPEIDRGLVPGTDEGHALRRSRGLVPRRGGRSRAPNHIPGTGVGEFIGHDQETKGHGQEIDEDHVLGTEEASIDQAGDEVIHGRDEDKLEGPTITIYKPHYHFTCLFSLF